MILYNVVTMHFRAQMRSCVLSATASTRCLCFNSGIVVKVQHFANYAECPSRPKSYQPILEFQNSTLLVDTDASEKLLPDD